MGSTRIILMADDDQEDCLLARIAFEASAIEGEIHFVGDGLELIDYLRNRGPRPHLILLDLNMPRMDGRRALREIKSDQELKDISVIILTTSRNERDVKSCLDAGACDFKTKPVEIDDWIEIIAASVRRKVE
ncbi:MAG: response regulator [Syntrophobacteraceae bacterium]